METAATVFVPAGFAEASWKWGGEQTSRAAAPEVSARLAGSTRTKGRRQRIHRRSFPVHFPIGWHKLERYRTIKGNKMLQRFQGNLVQADGCTPVLIGL